MNSLYAISPVDGRYEKITKVLSQFFSEAALMKYRLMIEIEYFIALSLEPDVKEVPRFTSYAQKELRSWYQNFSEEDAEIIKETEKTTDHDVKSVEYFFKQKLSQTPLRKYSEFIHFGLTSADINNLSFTSMWRDALHDVYIEELSVVLSSLKQMASDYSDTPLLSLTHGQSATPTTVGKEIAVFANRLDNQLSQLKTHVFMGKLGGATGTWAAHQSAYPNARWLTFSASFITRLGLEPNLLTTQVEAHDSMAESYHMLMRVNTILTDLSRDMWLYISRGVFGQKKVEGEVGSSTMPHKVNPIKFENAEGNAMLSNSLLSHLSQNLPVSRMQRDLSGSTVIRNIGVAMAHSLLALKNLQKGLSRVTVNNVILEKELNESWEVLAEAIQTVLRKVGHDKPYEKLKELTRGQKITEHSIKEFINGLDIPTEEKNRLLELTPQKYTGFAEKLVSLLNS